MAVGDVVVIVDVGDGEEEDEGGHFSFLIRRRRPRVFGPLNTSERKEECGRH